MHRWSLPLVIATLLACGPTGGPEQAQRLLSAPLPEQVPPPPGVPHCLPWEPDDPCLPRQRFKSRGLEKFTAIVDDDDRADLYCLDLPQSTILDKARVRATSAASVAIIDAGLLDPATNYTSLKHPTPTLANNHRFCRDEIFADQPLGARCSGVLLKDGRVLTVEHCVVNLETVDYKTTTLADLRFVFDFEAPDPSGPSTHATSPLITCKPREGSQPIPTLNRAMFVELDPDCPVIAAERGTTIAEKPPGQGEAVYAIGYPRGLPAKFSGWGTISSPGSILEALLDIAPGNSGSPVFNAAHELVGVIDEDGNHEVCASSVQGAPCSRWEGCAKQCGAPTVIHTVQPIHDVASGDKGERP